MNININQPSNSLLIENNSYPRCAMWWCPSLHLPFFVAYLVNIPVTFFSIFHPQIVYQPFQSMDRNGRAEYNSTFLLLCRFQFLILGQKYAWVFSFQNVPIRLLAILLTVHASLVREWQVNLILNIFVFTGRFPSLGLYSCF